MNDLPDDVKCDKSAASGSASSATGATTPTSSSGAASASTTGDSDSADTNAGAREGAAGIFGVAMAMLFAL